MSCGTDNTIRLGPMTVGSTKRLEFPLTKDGVAWTGADDVTLTLRAPSGVEIERDASLTLPDAGVWYYDLVVGEIDEVGDWLVFVRVEDGAVDDTYPYEIVLEVVEGA